MERNFYPMLSTTIKSFIQVADDKQKKLIFDILCKFPDIQVFNKTPIISGVFSELERQYARWNKGGNK